MINFQNDYLIVYICFSVKKYFMNGNNWNRFLELCEEKFKCDIKNDSINYLSKNRITYELLSHSSPNELESGMFFFLPHKIYL